MRAAIFKISDICSLDLLQTGLTRPNLRADLERDIEAALAGMKAPELVAVARIYDKARKDVFAISCPVIFQTCDAQACSACRTNSSMPAKL